MLTRQPDNILSSLGSYVLNFLPDSKTWFNQVKELCFQYGLPHPLQLLQDPPEKELFKRTVKLNVLQFWQSKLSEDSMSLSSLGYFKPKFMSLDRPHPLWTTCGANIYESNKAFIQAKFLFGRFRTEKLLSKFSSSNSAFCQLHVHQPEVSDLEHLLVHCPVLAERRALLFEFWDALTH